MFIFPQLYDGYVQSLQPQLKARFLSLVLVQPPKMIYQVYVQLFQWRPQQP